MKIVRVSYKENIYFGILKGSKISILSNFSWQDYSITNLEIDTKDVNFISPVLPKKIICIALNYVDNLILDDNEPLVFFKPPTSIIPDKGSIEASVGLNEVWGESELAFVIKKDAKNIKESDAQDYIFGYTIANDVTANNTNNRDHHLARSKGSDTFCAVGPWIDTNFIPASNYIRGYQNNVLIRQSTLNKRSWSDAKILSWLSTWLTLESGDLVLTGAPPRITNKIFLKHNDVYKCEIENLGSIENRYINKNI